MTGPMVSVRQSAHSRMIGRRWSKKLPVRYARLTSTYAPHQPPPGHRITHAGHVQHGAFGRHQAAPTIQPPQPRLLIPDPGPVRASFARAISATIAHGLFTVADVVGPDLRQGEFPSLQLTTQPLLHSPRRSAQRCRWRWTQSADAAWFWCPPGIRRIDAPCDRRSPPRRPAAIHRKTISSQRVQQPMDGWFFQAPNNAHLSGEPRALGQLVRRPLAEHIRRRHRGEVGVDEVAL